MTEKRDLRVSAFEYDVLVKFATYFPFDLITLNKAYIRIKSFDLLLKFVGLASAYNKSLLDIVEEYLKGGKMNVDDVEFEKPEGDMLELIFEKQEELMDKYHEIEIKQGVGFGLLQGQEFNINNIRSQELVKNFAWRVVEELTEATICTPSEQNHFFEELADALHFLVELCIIVNITPLDLVKEHPMKKAIHPKDKLVKLCSINFKYFSPYRIVQEMGMAMNCLKQKPWKQTHVLTDERNFRKWIMRSFLSLLSFWICSGSNAFEIYRYYFKKNKVNQFRQKSQY